MNVKRVWKFTFLFSVVFVLPIVWYRIFLQLVWMSETFICICMLFPLKSTNFHIHSDISPQMPVKKKFPNSLNVSVFWCKCQGRLRQLPCGLNGKLIALENFFLFFICYISQEHVCRMGEGRLPFVCHNQTWQLWHCLCLFSPYICVFSRHVKMFWLFRGSQGRFMVRT